MNTQAQVPATTLCAALCAVLIGICSQACALPPQSRVQSGTIEAIESDARILRDPCCFGTIATIDHNARILWIQRPGKAIPLTLVWNRRTIFVEGARFVDATRLKKGTAVTVWYRTPFFGKRFATKIVIERSAARPKQQRPHRSTATRAMNTPKTKRALVAQGCGFDPVNGVQICVGSHRWTGVERAGTMSAAISSKC
jgi:hypothetical protein